MDDIRPFLEFGFLVDLAFELPIDARNFMNSFYDGLIEGLRVEPGCWN